MICPIQRVLEKAILLLKTQLTLLSVHISVDFTGQEASFVHGSIGVMRNVQERIIGIVDTIDTL